MVTNTTQQQMTTPASALLESHPCFNQKAAHAYARIHLPVAWRCNVQCRFYNRKYSCVNESRPGVTAEVMTPQEALKYLDTAIEKIPNISVVGIAGPGDPFASPRETLETFSLVRQKYPSLMLCVSSNGLGIVPYIYDLKKTGISHVTLTVNAIDPDVGADIYEWMSWDRKLYNGTEASIHLWETQKEAITKLVAAGILVKINTVYIPGINHDHVAEISRAVAASGASLHNIIPLIPVKDTKFEHIPEPTQDEMNTIRSLTQQYLPQMRHCSRCRADAAGLLGENRTFKDDQPLQFAAKVDTTQLSSSSSRNQLSPERPYVAVATKDAVLVNMHLGESPSIHIYAPGQYRHKLVEIRTIPKESSECGNDRWNTIASLLKDCSHLLVSGVGPVPKSVLTASGIKVLIIDDYIRDVLSALFNNTAIQEKGYSCQGSCSGSTPSLQGLHV